MNSCRLISAVILFCCSLSLVFSEADFSQVEDNILSISSAVDDKSPEADEFEPYLKVNKDGIKVYIFSHKNSDFATFKAITHIKTSLDSILAVMLDNSCYIQWIDDCNESYIIEEISFNERYHYQVYDTPLPFTDRDFIFHSVMTQNPQTRAVTFTMVAVTDYCNDKQSVECNKLKHSELVRVSKSIGTYKLEPTNKGTKITWIQHTDPAGNLPAWLVNQFIKNMPYNTFKNLAKIVQREQYKFAELVYGDEGVAVSLKMPMLKPLKTVKNF